ncbi:gastrin/cholecystokinin-like peptide [Seriola lalandi dorsalis]|uniref:Gastrin/cholecystokinin-like peptide n=1 Tax=Seriola lalandi dorsalis TaxID=1841481 RepID=A0A3B4XEN7_SERLL|nr:gastrin/cholecystokinin-like peptide [Seriola lalandi dorsalis]XP_056228112.1 gastrin/cholecystokinin-like peptide [Seriola aureovittata]
MSGKVIVVFALLVALLVSGAASSPESSASGDAKERNTLQRLLAKRETVRDTARRQGLAPQTHSSRMERRAHLSEDEREIMTKQIMQAISEVMNSECMSDRDYQGWVDFGRRDAE